MVRPSVPENEDATGVRPLSTSCRRHLVPPPLPRRHDYPEVRVRRPSRFRHPHPSSGEEGICGRVGGWYTRVVGRNHSRDSRPRRVSPSCRTTGTEVSRESSRLTTSWKTFLVVRGEKDRRTPPSAAVPSNHTNTGSLESGGGPGSLGPDPPPPDRRTRETDSHKSSLGGVVPQTPRLKREVCRSVYVMSKDGVIGHKSHS